MKRVSGVLMRPIYFSFPRGRTSFCPLPRAESPFSQLKTNGQKARESNRNWEHQNKCGFVSQSFLCGDYEMGYGIGYKPSVTSFYCNTFYVQRCSGSVPLSLAPNALNGLLHKKRGPLVGLGRPIVTRPQENNNFVWRGSERACRRTIRESLWEN